MMEASAKPVRVLLVEDDEDDYILTRELFQEISKSGYVLDWVADYDSALNAMWSGGYDIYLLDYRLGRRNGLELLQQLSAEGCAVPVILLTGQGEREIDLEAAKAGAVDYLEKGRLDASLLERSIRYARERWEHQAELEERVRERTAELALANERLVSEVTERKRAEAALKEAGRRKDEFLAMLGHELRNPLAPIRSALEILKITGDEAAAERARATIGRQVGQMVRLIDDLLDLSRVSRGQIRLQKQPIDLAVAVHDAVETSRPLIEARGHTLAIALPPKPIYVDADLTRLAQMFLNLLNNSAKYTEPGGRIELTVETEGSEAVVRVRDTGVGIDTEMLGQVFEMFTQANPSLEGLGIGLALVRQLTEMHGGTIQATSQGPGQGSEFVIRLPISGAPLQVDKAARSGGKDLVSTSGQSRVLVVDDNQDAAESLSVLLQMWGNEVQTAFDGLQAVEVAEAFQPDVVLLDIGLPKLNGHDAARRIRERRKSGVILIALTGWGQEEDRRSSQDAGFDYHLVKPVEVDTLRELLAGIRA